MILSKGSNLKKNFISLLLVSFFSSCIFLYSDSLYIIKLQNFIYNSYTFFSQPGDFYETIINTQRKNKNLSELLVQQSLLNSKLINYEIENKKLRSMLSFEESFKHLSLMPANIVNSNNYLSIESKIINVGKLDGIYKNLTVIDITGNLVGKVINAGNKNSQIQLLTDNNFSVSVKVGENISIGQFRPTYGKFGFIEGIIKTLSIKEGDILYTSGISEIYPPDIPVAKVISNVKNKNKLFQDVGVEILTDVNNLYYVFVIQ
jgi:rod shape-determining protein MreC